MKIKTKIFGIIMLISLIFTTATMSVAAEDKAADEIAVAEAVDITAAEGTENSEKIDTGSGSVAANENGAVYGIDEAAGDTDAPGTANGDKVEDIATSGGTSDEAAGDTDTDDGAPSVEENIFSEVWGLIQEYSSEIFSFLALIGSLILAYLYKMGLTPLLQNALSAIGTAVTSLKESAERGEEASGAVSAALGDRLEAAEALITRVSESVERVSEGLAAREAEAGERASLKVVLAAQIDMLYEIFMTSALPQYKKDAVGERIAEMRRAIGVDEAGA